MTNKIAFFSLTILLSYGCSQKPFQSIPPVFETWTKPGANSEDVKRALRACGFHNIGTGFDVNDMRLGRISQNDQVLAQLCMEGKGFEHSSGRRTCSHSFNAELPACN